MVKAAHRIFTSSPVDLELNRDFNGDDYEYEDEAKLVIFPDHFEIPLPNIEELPALVSELLLHGSLCLLCCFGVLFVIACSGRVHSVVPLWARRLLHLIYTIQVYF